MSKKCADRQIHTHTLDDYCNPPPTYTFGLIMMLQHYASRTYMQLHAGSKNRYMYMTCMYLNIYKVVGK